ncbi:hypothetical protein P7C73_g4547, partial [Tremellales sp. Uapishka_1]
MEGHMADGRDLWASVGFPTLTRTSSQPSQTNTKSQRPLASSSSPSQKDRTKRPAKLTSSQQSITDLTSPDGTSKKTSSQNAATKNATTAKKESAGHRNGNGNGNGNGRNAKAGPSGTSDSTVEVISSQESSQGKLSSREVVQRRLAGKANDGSTKKRKQASDSDDELDIISTSERETKLSSQTKARDGFKNRSDGFGKKVCTPEKKQTIRGKGKDIAMARTSSSHFELKEGRREKTVPASDESDLEATPKPGKKAEGKKRAIKGNRETTELREKDIGTPMGTSRKINRKGKEVGVLSGDEFFSEIEREKERIVGEEEKERERLEKEKDKLKRAEVEVGHRFFDGLVQEKKEHEIILQQFETLASSSVAAVSSPPRGGDSGGESDEDASQKARTDEMFCATYKNLRTLCPFCSKPFPKKPSTHLSGLRASLVKLSEPAPTGSNPAARSLPWTQTITFCEMHDAETSIIPLGIRAGFPLEVDFLQLYKRLEAGWMRKDLGRIMRHPTKSRFYIKARNDILRVGKTAWGSVSHQSSDSSMNGVLAGYYGDLGRLIISTHFQNLLKWGLLPTGNMQPLTPADFISFVLVPETSVLLIQDHEGVTKAEAIDQWKRSSLYGRWRFRDDGEEAKRIMKEIKLGLESREERAREARERDRVEEVMQREKRRKTPLETRGMSDSAESDSQEILRISVESGSEQEVERGRRDDGSESDDSITPISKPDLSDSTRATSVSSMSSRTSSTPTKRMKPHEVQTRNKSSTPTIMPASQESDFDFWNEASACADRLRI